VLPIPACFCGSTPVAASFKVNVQSWLGTVCGVRYTFCRRTNSSDVSVLKSVSVCQFLLVLCRLFLFLCYVSIDLVNNYFSFYKFLYQSFQFYNVSVLLETLISVFTARCTLVQSAVLPSHVVCLSVCLSVCNVGEL